MTASVISIRSSSAEHGNLVGLGVYVGLAQDHAVSMIERREQVPAVLAAVPGPA
jgi:hypothetical protein